MKKKKDLLFGFLYFGLILLGYTGAFFTFLADLLFGSSSEYIFYYDYLIIVIQNIMRFLIYIIGFIILHYTYIKMNKDDDHVKIKKDKLSIKKKTILYSITLLTITIISIMAGWQLKILNDLGEKYNIYNVYVKLTEVAAYMAEIYLLCKMLFHFDNFTTNNFKSYKYFTFAIILILLTYSIYSLIVDFSIYQLIFIPFTILLGFIYPYADRRILLTYSITLLVFLF